MDIEKEVIQIIDELNQKSFILKSSVTCGDRRAVNSVFKMLVEVVKKLPDIELRVLISGLPLERTISILRKLNEVRSRVLDCLEKASKFFKTGGIFEMKQKNECVFCGRPTNYYSYDLLCYICPKCLGEYKNASGNVVIYPYRYPYTLPEPFLSRQVWGISSTLTTSEPSPKRKIKK